MAGERTALNLTGIEKDELARGMTLAPPEMLRPSKRLDVSLTLLASAKPLKDRARVHFHAYTAETVAEVVLREAKQVAPGATAFAQLRLQDPVLLLPGDRFILRQFSPVVTLGGGVVLDTAPLKKQENRAEFLATLAAGDPAEVVVARLARRGMQGLDLPDLVAETGWTPERAEAVVASLFAIHRIVRHGDHLTDVPAYAAARKMVQTAITDFHAKNPLVAGMNKEDLRSRLDLPAAVFEGVLNALVRQQAIEISGEQIRTAGGGVVMKDDEAESKKTIEQAFASAGLKVPALKEVLAGLKLDRARAQKIVTLLLREKTLVKISDDLVFHRDALADLRRRVTEQKTKSPKMDVAAFKELTGVSRKYAIPLLEYLDRERVTRRVGDERVIL
jgi:selenocysteine-specific elongation factor